MLIAIVKENGDIQTFDTEEDNCVMVFALSLKERHMVFEIAAKKHERARDNPSETNNIMHVCGSAKIRTADDDSTFRRLQYRARDALIQRNNFKVYMGEEIRSPDGKDDEATALVMPTNRVVMPGGA